MLILYNKQDWEIVESGKRKAIENNKKRHGPIIPTLLGYFCC